jgi:hypothetical protein
VAFRAHAEALGGAPFLGLEPVQRRLAHGARRHDGVGPWFLRHENALVL